MKKTIVIKLSLVLSILVSCSDNSSLTNKSSTDYTSEIINKIQGVYEGCVPYEPSPVSYSKKYTVEVSGDSYKVKNRLSNSACTSHYYSWDEEFTISEARYEDSSTENILLNLKVNKYSGTFFHSWYLSQNYCGFNDWTLNTEKELTGVNCPELFTGNPHYTGYFAANTDFFIKIISTASTFSHPVGNAQNGNSWSTHLSDGLLLLNKQ